MADDNTPHGEPGADAPQETAPQETDWKAEARKWETRAKENLTAAKANEAAAQRLAEFEESQKTEAQKLQDRLAAAEQRAAEVELRALRAEVAADKGIPAALLSGSTKEELEASATALIEFKGITPTDDVPAPRTYIVPEEGGLPNLGATTTPTPGIGTLRAAYAKTERQ
ncbi:MULTISPECIES: hypothetical protein [unclassified Microbacterium]|uniref:hypothetical protein n=1 Tax=unclassified Microbacterium TaxID=2609290 RepID=UPI0038635667